MPHIERSLIVTHEERKNVDPAGDGDAPQEGGKTAAGESAGSRGQLDSAGGGYGTHSGTGSSGGTGDGDAAAGRGPDADGPAMDDGSTTATGGASGQGPTEWLRGESSED